MSFKKKDTIKKKNEIKNVIYSGERLKSHCIDIFYCKSKKRRMAVLITKANGNATERNKIKRRIREIYRKIKIEEKIEIIIKIKKNIISESYKTIEEEIKKITEKIKKKERTK